MAAPASAWRHAMNSNSMRRSARPLSRGRDTVDALLADCAEACFSCASACAGCADACLAEDRVAELRQCIRLNLDCADICAAAGGLVSRRGAAPHRSSLVRQMIELCAEACHHGGKECERHAPSHTHCRDCAEICQTCEASCRAVLGSVRL